MKITVLIYYLADRIIYANPCKQSSYIRFAKEVGVEIMTFDNEQELLKIKQIHPNAK
jgi:ornithine decarboxylase